MPLESRSNLAAAIAALSLFAAGLAGQSPLVRSAGAQEWQLPSALRAEDSGRRTYRFTVDYTTFNTTGGIVHRERLSGEYTRGLPGREVVWNHVTDAEADGATSAFPAARTVSFMDGFRYGEHSTRTMQAGFFKGFPPSAVVERNLVWDTGMIEDFGQDFFAFLRLNQPYHPAADGDVHMPAVGTFHNRDIVLEWIGRSRRNGQDCALISYHAFMNPLRIESGGFTLNGRSDYWGEIWVSLATRQIEYATLHENVIGQMQLTRRHAPTLVSVFRSGVFEPVNGK